MLFVIYINIARLFVIVVSVNYFDRFILMTFSRVEWSIERGVRVVGRSLYNFIVGCVKCNFFCFFIVGFSSVFLI